MKCIGQRLPLSAIAWVIVSPFPVFEYNLNEELILQETEAVPE
jgi:hypothetical protein